MLGEDASDLSEEEELQLAIALSESERSSGHQVAEEFIIHELLLNEEEALNLALVKLTLSENGHQNQDDENEQLARAISLSINESNEGPDEIQQEEDRILAAAISLSINKQSEANSSDQLEEDRQLATAIAELEEHEESEYDIEVTSGLDGFEFFNNELPRGNSIGQNSVLENATMVQRGEGNLCVICRTEESICIYVPCAHRVICRECSRQVKKRRMWECPVCRTPATSII